MTTAAAMEVILAAAAAGKAFTFLQPNPKTGKSREHCEVYKVVTAFAGLEALKGDNFPGTTRPVFRGGAMALSGDFSHNVLRRLATFVEAKASPAEALSVPVVWAASVTLTAPALSFGVKPLNRVAARVFETQRPFA